MRQVGNLIELDPSKNYILLIDHKEDIDLDQIAMENGTIILARDIGNYKFIEKDGDFKEIAIVKGKQGETMDKCCNSCKDYEISCNGINHINQDEAKDYCSKWCEKEDSLCDQLTESLGQEPTYVLETIEYFKQRIEESRRDLREEIREYGPERTEDLLSNIGEYKHLFDKAFKWILD